MPVLLIIVPDLRQVLQVDQSQVGEKLEHESPSILMRCEIRTPIAQKYVDPVTQSPIPIRVVDWAMTGTGLSVEHTNSENTQVSEHRPGLCWSL